MNNPSKSFELIRLWPGLPSDPVTGRAGEMYFNSTTQSYRYHNGSIWVDIGGIWADQQLSNLTGTTSIPIDLLPSSSLSKNLGSNLLVWNSINVADISSLSTISDVLGGGINATTQSTTGYMASGGISLTTGDSVDGDTGSISIKAGTPSGGTTVFLQQNTLFGSTAFNFDTSVIGTNLAGISFVAASAGTVSSITFKLQNNTATPDVFSTQLIVYSDSGGLPGLQIASSAVTPVALAGSATSDQNYVLQYPVSLSSGQRYHFVLTAQAFASTLNLLGDATDVSSADFVSSTNSGGSWSSAAFPDPYFILYNTPQQGVVDLSGKAVNISVLTPLRFLNSTGTNFVAFKAPASITQDTTWILPNVDGAAGEALFTDGSGNLYWDIAAAASGISGSIQFSNGSGGFSSDSANLFWDDTNNRLGIGTSSPSYPLDVGPVTSQSRIGKLRLGAWPYDTNYAFVGHDALNHTLAGNYALAQGPSGDTYLNSASGQPIKFLINASEQMRVDSNGRVGIGTLSPGYKLDVASATNGATARIGSGYLGKYGDDFVFAAGGSFDSAGVWTATATQAYSMYLGATLGGAYIFADQGLTPSSTFSPTPRVTILGNGNIGLGVSPSYPLHLQANVGGYSAWFKNTVGGTLLGLEAAGVGGELVVLGAQSGTSVVGTQTNHSFYLRSNGTNKVQIDPTGNLILLSGDILPNTTNTKNVGSASLVMASVNATLIRGPSATSFPFGQAQINFGSGNDMTVSTSYGSMTYTTQKYNTAAPISFTTNVGFLNAGIATGNINLTSGNGSGTTGSINLTTGNSTGGSGSGSISLVTGTGSTRGSISMSARQLDVTNVTEGVATQIWKKYTVSHLTLQAAALTNDVPLFSLPAKGIISAVVIKHSTAFTGSFSAYTVSVGITGNLTKYSSPFDVYQAVGSGVGQSTAITDFEDMSSATSIRLAATSVGANLDTSAGGQVDVWVLWGILP